MYHTLGLNTNWDQVQEQHSALSHGVLGPSVHMLHQIRAEGRRVRQYGLQRAVRCRAWLGLMPLCANTAED